MTVFAGLFKVVAGATITLSRWIGGRDLQPDGSGLEGDRAGGVGGPPGAAALGWGQLQRRFLTQIGAELEPLREALRLGTI
jgi:hypothetical protein